MTEVTWILCIFQYDLHKDMNNIESVSPDQSIYPRGIVGASLVVGGGMALVGQITQWSWMTSLAILAGGMILLLGGVRVHSSGLCIAGWIVVGVGAGITVPELVGGYWSNLQRVGFILGLAGIGFGMIIPTLRMLFAQSSWWAAIPMAILVSTGISLFTAPFRLSNFILYPPVILGLVFIGIGVTRKWPGLIIPGSLILFSGLGVYVPWAAGFSGNSLTRTGTMLVIFAFGWVMITVLLRPLSRKMTWWPLIPGGVLAVVGWGLYIGGDPNNALTFIGNTGSIVLVILGIYLLLMRRGIHP